MLGVHNSRAAEKWDSMLFKKTCLFTTLTVLGVIWSHAVFAELPFKFVIDRWGGYQLEYQGKSYSLQIDYEGFVAPKGNSEDFPNHLLPVINIVNLFFDLPYDGPAKDFYLFRERKFLGTSKELLEIVKDRFGTEGISQEEYVSYAIEACLVHTNRNCLRNLISTDLTPKQEGQIY
ncbi:MAG TPA: hypothetical protein VJL87_06655, partial [Bdellovibrionota bacterium]|nr:hypothetical protein [Bdellovibrionota bacterium]